MNHQTTVAEWLGTEPGDLRRSVAVWLAVMGLTLMGVFHG